jgi:hypothetical protein
MNMDQSQITEHSHNAGKTSATLAVGLPVLEQYVEAEQAAPFVHMSPRHLKKLAREARIPAHFRGDGQRRRWLFLLSELDSWMRARINSSCDPCRESRRIQ